jgi:hypothetical protein
MNRISSKSSQVTQSRRIRLRRIEQRLDSLDTALHTIGVALWQTDERLRLLDCMGIAVAEGFIGRSISDFYRHVCGLEDGQAEPMRAHEDALRGESVTLHWTHHGEQFLVMIEARRDRRESIVGTVGMSLRLGAGG